MVLAITAIAALLCRWLADVPPTLDGRELTLEVEPRGGVPGGGGRKVNATPVDEDPGYHGAAGVSIRFSGWMSAVRVLREKCGGTFTNEPQSFLELSRVRTDRPVMRGNVCRGASYYLHPWAGV